MPFLSDASTSRVARTGLADRLAFDLLELEGEDLKGRPLLERKKRLQQLISGSEIRYNAELPGSADAVVRTVKEARLEGVIAKRRDSNLSR
jgi:bifunctional non-homologous end joining protein LigD